MARILGTFLSALPVAGIVLLAGCGKGPKDITMAMAKMEPTAGNTAKGEITFTKVKGGVRIAAEITGLTPGKHGFHIHEKGDCSAPDAKSAGGHHNPDGTPHGAPDNEVSQRHAGDLGNLVADESGKATYERVDKVLTLSGEKSIVGRAVIIHGGEDDLVSQPVGNAGNRVACGLIVKIS